MMSDRTPKYRKIIDDVVESIERGQMDIGQALPSINGACRRWSVSRDTVVKAYDRLKERGIIDSAHGKGFYVATRSVSHELKIFLLFDELSEYKRVLLRAFREGMGKRASIDIFFHHYNAKVFKTLIHENLGNYNYYVIMPFPEKSILSALKQIDSDRLLILDRNDLVGGLYPEVCQNFDEQVTRCLESTLEKLKKYNQFSLVFPQPSCHPLSIIEAFRDFCARHGISCEVLNDLEGRTAGKGQAYLVIEDDDLVTLTKMARAEGLKVGRDVGIISYNDTPLKEIIGDGVTVISTDFHQLGVRAAEAVLGRSVDREIVPTQLILRSSL